MDDKFMVCIEVDENSMLKELVNLRKIVGEMDKSISKLYFSIQGKQEAQDKEIDSSKSTGTIDRISQHIELESVGFKDMSAKDIIWEILSWTNNGHPRKSEVPSALHFDRETKTILIDKDLLMVAIQIISPYQENRNIKLLSRSEIKKWLEQQYQITVKK